MKKNTYIRKAIDFNRLRLQALFFNKYTKNLFENSIQTLDKFNIKLIINVGCALGYETMLLTEIFPNAYIIAIDNFKKYIEFANKVHNTNMINFIHQDDLTDLNKLIYQYGKPDLIYSRMFFMHFAHPLAKLQSIINSPLLKETIFVFEEPDFTVKNNLIENTIDTFKSLIIKFGEYRNERYDVGKMLLPFIQNFNDLNIINYQKQYACIKTQRDREYIINLMNSLLPIFKDLNLINIDTEKKYNEIIQCIHMHTDKIYFTYLHQIIFSFNNKYNMNYLK